MMKFPSIGCALASGNRGRACRRADEPLSRQTDPHAERAVSAVARIAALRRQAHCRPDSVSKSSWTAAWAVRLSQKQRLTPRPTSIPDLLQQHALARSADETKPVDHAFRDLHAHHALGCFRRTVAHRAFLRYWRTFAYLIALAKAKPGEFNSATGSLGAIPSYRVGALPVPWQASTSFTSPTAVSDSLWNDVIGRPRADMFPNAGALFST